MNKKLTKEQFIEKARKIHGDKFDYSKSIYLGSELKIEIICPTHDSFWQVPSNHLKQKFGCRSCAIDDLSEKVRKNIIKKFKSKHGDKFDYSKVNYVNAKTEVEIICPKHKSFWQLPYVHIISAYGCKLCDSLYKEPVTLDSFLKRANKKHKNKYDYSKVLYIKGNETEITIICPEHREFKQTVRQHLINGCASCARVKKLTLEEFVNRSKIIHNNYYSYEKSIYINNSKLIEITCPKHESFWQNPNSHLSGKGCKRCNKGNTSKIENEWMDSLKIPNDENHRHVKIQINGKNFIVDGYFPNSNIIYEFLGDFWHGNPMVFNFNDINKINDKTFGELFEKTKERIRLFRLNGYKVISIWERNFKKWQKKKR